MKTYIIEFRTNTRKWWAIWKTLEAEDCKDLNKHLQGTDLAIGARYGEDAKGLKIRARAYKPTIGDIADNCGQSHYFDRDTMKLFGQTRASFKVYPTNDPNIFQTVGIDPRTKNRSVAYWSFTGTDKRTLSTCWEQCNNPEET